jgi:hypothetical protein
VGAVLETSRLALGQALNLGVLNPLRWIKMSKRTNPSDDEKEPWRAIKILQKFTSAHASIHNHFNLDRHLNRKATFKENRSAALAEWRELAA